VRILHFSDIHIGMENYGRPATEDDVCALPDYFAPGSDRNSYLGLSTRLLDFLSAFDQIVEYALTESVDLVVFSGDAYKTREPSQTHQREFARRISSLAKHGIPVFLLVGNHDIPHALGRANALEIFPTLSVQSVTVAETLTTHVINTRAGSIQIVALPWPRWRNLLSSEEHRGKSFEELTTYVEAELTRRLLLEFDALDPAIPALLSGHVTIAGATTSSERSMTLGRDHVLQYSSLATPTLDYVALGHIHKHQVLGDLPPIVYPGSVQTIDFGEQDDIKGFCVVDIDPSKPSGHRATWEFIPVNNRRFHTIDVRIPKSEEDPTRLVLRSIDKVNIDGSIVRVRIQALGELMSRLDMRQIRQSLTTAHLTAGIKKEVIQTHRTRLGRTARGIAPDQALRWYLEQHDSIDSKVKLQVLNRGLELISEEGIQS
jgi:exonuclease SbcD